jgi:hypothetical protein
LPDAVAKRFRLFGGGEGQAAAGENDRPSVGHFCAHVMPVLFALILAGLANIQDHLENPFDRIGSDDVAIDPDQFIRSMDNEAMTTASASDAVVHGELPEIQYSQILA